MHMEFQQKFNDNSLEKLAKLFTYPRRMNPKLYDKVFKKSADNMKLMKIIIPILLFSLLIIYDAERKLTGFIKFGLVVAAVTSICAILINYWNKFYDKKVHSGIQNKFSKIIIVEINESDLIYNGKKFDYKEISYIIFHDIFIFIYVGNKLLVVQSNDIVSKLIKKKIEKYENITQLSNNDPFSILNYFPKSKGNQVI